MLITLSSLNERFENGDVVKKFCRKYGLPLHQLLDRTKCNGIKLISKLNEIKIIMISLNTCELSHCGKN